MRALSVAGRALPAALLVLSLCAGRAALAGAPQPSLAQRLAEHHGKIVVLNFWASWCGPCEKELPLLGKLQREYAPRGVQFVGASTDAPEDRERAEALLERSNVEYPIWYGLSSEEMRQVGLGEALPVTAVFDRTGARVFRLVGEVRRKRLVERLEWLLGEQRGTPPRELWLPAGVDASAYTD